jgi:hypothetical protein
MFRASLCPSSGAYQLQHQPLVYLRNVVIAVLLVVVGPAGPTSTAITCTDLKTLNLNLKFYCNKSTNIPD